MSLLGLIMGLVMSLLGLMMGLLGLQFYGVGDGQNYRLNRVLCRSCVGAV